MKDIKQEKNGFSLVETLLILVVLVVIGAVVYLIVSHDKNNNNVAAKSAKSSINWLSYCDSAAKLCFKYPNNWKITGEDSPPNNLGNVQTVINKAADSDVQYGDISASLGDPTQVFSSNPLSTSAPPAGTTVNLASSYPFYITAITNMVTKGSPYKVISGYYTSSTENLPAIFAVDASNVKALSLKAGKSNTLNLNTFNLSDSLTGTNIIIFGGGPISNTSYTASEAAAWLKTSQASLVLQMINSLYPDQNVINS